MILYHGSNHIVAQPLYDYGRADNDYGRGFYCTENLQLAKEWGVTKENDGFVNKYVLPDTGLTILNLNTPEFSLLHWLTILVQNREPDLISGLAVDARAYLIEKFSIVYESYDIIRGYRADDSYFTFAQDFLNGAISVRQLNRAMHLGYLGEQIVLKSEKAFREISFSGSEMVDKALWYPRKETRDRSARRTYLQDTQRDRRRDDLYITQILLDEIGPDDERLQ